MQKINSEVLGYFVSNPNEDTLFFTSDGFAFKNVNDANAHAGNLSNT